MKVIDILWAAMSAINRVLDVNTNRAAEGMKIYLGLS